MEKHQIDQYDMLLSVENHFDDNATLWSSNAPLTADKTLLSNKIDALQLQVNAQLLATTGVTADKEVSRLSLEALAFVQSSAVCGYAGSINNNALYDKCYFTKTDLSRLRDAELLGNCTILYNEAAGVLPSLTAWGITAATQTAFQNATNAFAAIMKNPTEAIGKRTTATANIASLIPDMISNVLERRLDNDIVALATTQPDFVSTYNNIRLIQNSPTSTMSVVITVLAQGTNLPIANAHIALSPENIERDTSNRGVCKVLNLPDGPHTLVATHPAYLTITQGFIAVNGETAEVVVVMVPIAS